MTTEDFAKIFYSNFTPQTDWDILNEINWMYEEQLFTFKASELASNEEFQKRVELVTDPKSGFIRGGESTTHLALKSFGRDYLINHLKIEERNVLYEYELDGFKVDVIDRLLRFPIECGDTNALKFEKYLSLSKVQNFSIIPYPRLQNLSIYIFSTNPSFFEYIKFKNSYLNSQRAKFR